MSSLLRKPAPAFKAPVVLPGGAIKDISLQDYKGKWTILVFYPMDFTFVCPTELIAFSDAYEKFKALKCELIGISCDSEYSHLAWVNTPKAKGGLGEDFKLPLLADKTKQIARDYMCLYEDEGIAFRATYIIDPELTVRCVLLNDLPVGRSVDETMRLLEAFQFTDKHGEVCPANFNAKDRKVGLVADPKKAKAYFEEVNK